MKINYKKLGKLLTNYIDINSEIKSINKYTLEEEYDIKFNKKTRYTLLSFILKNKYTLNILPEGDCCSFSFFVELPYYRFEKLSGETIVNVKEIKNKSIIKKDIGKQLYKYNEQDIDGDFYRIHLYYIYLKSKKIFKLGMINASNGYYDGWIELYLNK